MELAKRNPFLPQICSKLWTNYTESVVQLFDVILEQHSGLMYVLLSLNLFQCFLHKALLIPSPWSRTGRPGHTARNEQSLVLKDLKKVETEMDILLPGTPFQNNIKELYHTLLCAITMEPADASIILAKIEAITHQWEVINKRLDHMGFLKEQVGFPDTRQDEDHSSCELRGKTAIPYTPMNMVAVLPSIGVHDSSFCGTLDIVRSYEDQTLVVGTQALVDPLDDEIDSPSENDLCPSSASTYNLTKFPLPSNESIQTLDPCEKQDESTLVCELITTSEGEQNDQPGVDVLICLNV
ncbi:hypothetical protein BC332_12855 [Capsicum chinense]|nr:hypothetical protein BC332_12855 [Capsicum chinense]